MTGKSEIAIRARCRRGRIPASLVSGRYEIPASYVQRLASASL